jgi:hypothetical protein
MTDAGLSNDCPENSETAKAAEEIAKEMQLCESLHSSQALPVFAEGLVQEEEA